MALVTNTYECKAIIKLPSKEYDAGTRDSEIAMDQTSTILEVERYLNDKVATDLYKKFGVGFRIHL
jgi:hypothetical protein